MKSVLENFKKTMLNESSVEEMVDEYYSDLSEEERQERKEYFLKKLENGISKNGEWIRKTLMTSFERKMKIERKRRNMSDEEREQVRKAETDAIIRSQSQSREMTKKYGRRWNK